MFSNIQFLEFSFITFEQVRCDFSLFADSFLTIFVMFQMINHARIYEEVSSHNMTLLVISSCNIYTRMIIFFTRAICAWIGITFTVIVLNNLLSKIDCKLRNYRRYLMCIDGCE